MGSRCFDEPTQGGKCDEDRGNNNECIYAGVHDLFRNARDCVLIGSRESFVVEWNNLVGIVAVSNTDDLAFNWNNKSSTPNG